ncbi:hypothetical protein MRX96_025570 [Rhipicephalus microplus]
MAPSASSFKEGHVERVAPLAPLGHTVSYVLHHAVIRPEAVTAKVHVVFDASSHECDSSTRQAFVAPFHATARILFQRLWGRDLD